MFKVHILSFTFLAVLFFQSCVSPRVHEEVVEDRNRLESSLSDCRRQLSETEAEQDSLQEIYTSLLKQKEKLVEDTTLMGKTLRNLKRLNSKLENTYERLIENKKELLSEEAKKTRELLTELNVVKQELQAKENALAEKSSMLENKDERLDKLQKDLEKREEKVEELESVLSAKDSTVSELRDKVSRALYSFNESGLSVKLKNSKVYVTMQDRLLFASGSYKVDKEGKTALSEIAKILKENKEVTIMVEGHTDDVPVIPGSKYADNWELSVLRATEVVKYLVNEGGVSANRLIAAGRGPTQPVEEGDSKEVRRKNRRTEIILTPKLDDLFEILEKN